MIYKYIKNKSINFSCKEEGYFIQTNIFTDNFNDNSDEVMSDYLFAKKH